MTLESINCKILIFCAFAFAVTSASIPSNQRSGHGLFHGLGAEHGKSSWPDKAEDQTLNINPINSNHLIDRSDVKQKHTSIFLQSEPRGLQYMLNTDDINPFIVGTFRKREINSNINRQFIPVPQDQHRESRRCVGTRFFCVQSRSKRQTLPGNIIPGSRGQAVLYGVPNPGQLPGNNFQPPGQPNQYPNNGQFFPTGQHTGGYKTYGY